MNAQCTAVAFDQHIEISACLRGLYGAECVRLLRHRKVFGIVARDLQEDTGVRATFIGLSRGVKKSWPEAENRGYVFLVADRVTNESASCFSCASFIWM